MIPGTLFAVGSTQSFDGRALSKVAAKNAANRQILIEIGPRKTEREYLDVSELMGRPNCQTRILSRGKAELSITEQCQNNPAIKVDRSPRTMDQGVHATFESSVLGALMQAPLPWPSP